MLHWREALPSSQHSLQPQHTLVCPAVSTGSCQAGSPQPAASTGTARAARGALLGTRAGTEGDGRECPIAGKGKGCRLHRNRALRVLLSAWHRGMDSKARVLCAAPAQGTLASAKLEGTQRSQVSPAQPPQSDILCLRACPSCSQSSGSLGKALATLCQLPPARAGPCRGRFWMPSHAQLCWLLPFSSMLTPNRP